MTIAARVWIETTTVADAIFDRWPDYRVLLVAADAVDVRGLRDTVDRLVDEATAVARRSDPVTVHPHVARWHDAFRDFGVKPRVGRVSVDALTRRAATDSGLPRIGVLVDLYNAISVLHQVPIGGEDLDRYTGPARLIVATGGEPFMTNANGEPVVEHPEPGEPVWMDDVGVTCRRWNWRQTTRTALRDDTTRVGFIIDSLEAPDHLGAERAATQLAELLGADLVRSLDRHHH